MQQALHHETDQRKEHDGGDNSRRMMDQPLDDADVDPGLDAGGVGMFCAVAERKQNARETTQRFPVR